MTLILDASALYAQIDRDEPLHADVVDVLRSDPGPFRTSEMAVGEVDHLLLARFGVEVELEFLDDLVKGTFVVDCLSAAEIDVAKGIVRRYGALEVGVTDASLVVLAQKHRTRKLVTIDERTFRAVTPLQGGHFTILPADR